MERKTRPVVEPKSLNHQSMGLLVVKLPNNFLVCEQVFVNRSVLLPEPEFN